MGNPEGRRHLGMPRRRSANIVKMDLGEIGSGVMDWTGLLQVRDQWRILVNTQRTFGFRNMLGIS
jgi:hypothetical protein